MPIQDYRRIGCGCCTGRELPGGSGVRTDQCVCHIHQDITRGLRAGECSVHARTPGQIAYEQDLRRRPCYQDGQPRRTWDQLPAVIRQSWETTP